MRVALASQEESVHRVQQARRAGHAGGIMTQRAVDPDAQPAAEVALGGGFRSLSGWAPAEGTVG